MDLLFFEKSNTMADEKQHTEVQLPDMTDLDEVRKAIIANEILNRKY